MIKRLIILSVGVAVLLSAEILAADELPSPFPWFVGYDWGPVASEMVDADGNERFRAAGPFWESAESPDGKRLQAFPRPLFARAMDPEANRTSWDCIWPLSSGKVFYNQQSWRVVNSYFFNRDRTDPTSQYYYWFFPFWFHGRDDDGVPYRGLFPIAGEIRDVLWKDRISFALWPLWMQTQVNDMTTSDVLWPILSWTSTPDHHQERFRIFPFYAFSRNTRQFEKYSVLWPIWTHANYTHPKATGTAWVLFPLAGRVNLNSQQGWMFLPPFFQHVKSEKMTRTYFPWPFFQRETGFRERLYIWPFYGRRKDGVLERRFWIWPLVINEKNLWGTRRSERWSVIPFFNNVTYSRIPMPDRKNLKAADEAAEAAAAEGKLPIVARRTKLWPLGSRQYDLETESYRFRCLDLWPGVHPPAVERSWAPFWTLWDYRVHGEKSDLDVMWGIYRDTRRPEGARAFSLFPLWKHERAEKDTARRWSFLKGLIAYDRTATTCQVRFLWLGRMRMKTKNPVPEDLMEDSP